MPRKLKTFITNLGFFELAIAAPSMKAALEAWGMRHNAFHQGFAKETEDTKIIAATEANPGVVLKRPVGSPGPFKLDAELPTTLPGLKPPKLERAAPKKKEQKRAKAPSSKSAQKDRSAIISFEKARAKRERERVANEAKLEKERERHKLAKGEAEAAYDEAREEHEAAMAAIAKEQDKLDLRIEKENKRWMALSQRLKAAIDGAKRRTEQSNQDQYRRLRRRDGVADGGRGRRRK